MKFKGLQSFMFQTGTCGMPYRPFLQNRIKELHCFIRNQTDPFGRVVCSDTYCDGSVPLCDRLNRIHMQLEHIFVFVCNLYVPSVNLKHSSAPKSQMAACLESSIVLGYKQDYVNSVGSHSVSVCLQESGIRACDSRSQDQCFTTFYGVMSSSLWVEGPMKHSTLEGQGIIFLRNVWKHTQRHTVISQKTLVFNCTNV